MNNSPFVPRKTVEEMNALHPPGTRHAALFTIGMSLIGQGFSHDAVFTQLRATFDAEKTDKEIRDVVSWCASKNPQPCGLGNGMMALPQRPMNGHSLNGNGHKPPAPPTPEQVISGEMLVEADWFEKSPVQIPEALADHGKALFQALYAPSENVNLVRTFFIADDGKPKPKGAGGIMTQEKWIEWFDKSGPPFSEVGCWIRFNPCNEKGTGKNGAVSDADIASFRYMMIESDTLPIDVQLSLYGKIELPLSAIIYSGGDSAHAWFKIDCKNAEDYEETVKAIYEKIAPLGFDKANKNPSRLSRLPGVIRELGGKGDKAQRLIYLNPKPKPLNWKAFIDSVTPVVGLLTGHDLVERMREFFKPKPFPFTIDWMKGKDLYDGFYFRDFEVTLWSGISGHGKTTMLATVMVSLLADRVPIFVSSLEIRAEKLCELLTQLVYAESATEEQSIKFLKEFGTLFSFFDKTGMMTRDSLFMMMRAAHRKYGARHFFIDSLMRISGLAEDYPAQGEFVTDLQSFAKEIGGHVHLVAHPKKTDENLRMGKMDVKGSSDLVNNADNVVTVRRNNEKRKLHEAGKLTSEKEAEIHDAEFAVEKQRETGWEGVIKLKYCRLTKTYEPFVPLKKEPKANPHAKHYRQNE